METEAEIIAVIRGNDENSRAAQDAWTALYRMHYQRLYAAVYGFVNDGSLASEIVQETFIRAKRFLHRFREDARFFTWTYRISRNIAIDALRARQRQRRLFCSFDDLTVAEAISALRQAEKSTVETYELRELALILLQAIHDLPDVHREVLELVIEGKTYVEIAAIQKVQLGTVMSRLFYARQKIQAVIKRLNRE